MSWSPDLFIGEFRPWPDTVHVVRGKTEETRRYVPEEMLFHERDGHDEQFERARSLEDENARLRSCLSDDAENARMIMGENAKLRELVALMYRDMQGVLDMSTDTVWVDDVGTLRDEMDCHMQAMAELGMPPADYERRMRELGVEVDG